VRSARATATAYARARVRCQPARHRSGWQRGAQGEAHVGAIIDGMRDDGWFAIHDVSVGRGNVDHILIVPPGIFTVETKSHPGRIDARNVESWMLKQAYAESKLLLVFSRAYLTPAVSRQEGVVVLPSRLLAGHRERRGPSSRQTRPRRCRRDWRRHSYRRDRLSG
jgi:hypothetical protein